MKKETPEKILVKLYIGTDVLEWFKFQNDDYETLINDLLRSYYNACHEDPPKV